MKYIVPDQISEREEWAGTSASSRVNVTDLGAFWSSAIAILTGMGSKREKIWVRRGLSIVVESLMKYGLTCSLPEIH